MGLQQLQRGVGILGTLCLLVACTPGQDRTEAGFRQDYAAARTALESGDYDRAARLYQGLLPAAGPLDARLRIEYAHALLRANRFDEAAAEATAVANGQTGAARASALAVLGTAAHESALKRMAADDYGPATQGSLILARQALDEMLAGYPNLDPEGSMAQRRQQIVQALADPARYRKGGP